MQNWRSTLNRFLLQSHSGDLRTSTFPKEYADLDIKIGFGMGTAARVPWIAFLASGMRVSNGIYPVYLYYKDAHVLVLAYGVSETQESAQSWPAEIINSMQTIGAYLDRDVPRYGDSFVFKAYKIEIQRDEVIYKYFGTDTVASDVNLESDLNKMIEYYKKLVSAPTSPAAIETSQGLIFMEKQLEDFIIKNWAHTELGKKLDLIVDEGELLSQQYKTDIGRIDILAKDKRSGSYVVIELKKNQTSDDTIGQPPENEHFVCARNARADMTFSQGPDTACGEDAVCLGEPLA